MKLKEIVKAIFLIIFCAVMITVSIFAIFGLQTYLNYREWDFKEPVYWLDESDRRCICVDKNYEKEETK